MKAEESTFLGNVVKPRSRGFAIRALNKKRISLK